MIIFYSANVYLVSTITRNCKNLFYYVSNTTFLMVTPILQICNFLNLVLCEARNGSLQMVLVAETALHKEILFTNISFFFLLAKLRASNSYPPQHIPSSYDVTRQGRHQAPTSSSIHLAKPSGQLPNAGSYILRGNSNSNFPQPPKPK